MPLLKHKEHMADIDKNQELSADELAFLDKEMQRHELARLVDEKNIAIKQESGYFEAVSINALIDEWRRTNKDGYGHLRRRKAEEKAAKEGRTLRAYKPATLERRNEQVRASKAKSRSDPAKAAAEREKNTAARAAARAAMTEAEREAVNKVRREKRAAKKPLV